MEKLPAEIAFEIFSRLPPESVVRCKLLVCKSWCSLLSGSDSNNFANMHLRRSRQYLQHNSTLNFIALHKFRSSGDNDIDQLEVRRNSGAIVGEFYITEYNDHEENKLNNYKVKTIKIPDHIRIRSLTLVGSCNGLLCLTTSTHDQSSKLSIKDRIWICNPLLNEYVPLPVSDLQLKYCNTYTTTCNRVVGFGHLPSTDEYKVVTVYYSHSNSYVGEVEVYTLGKSNGMWTSKGTIECGLSLTRKRPVLINGSLHWFATKGNQSADLHIVSFDLEVEKFHDIPAMPQVQNRNGYYVMRFLELHELGGYLCLIHTEEKFVDVWAWKDHMNNKEYSWEKEFNIKWRKSKPRGYYSTCAIEKKKNGDDLVLMWCTTKNLVYYDVKSQSFEYVPRYYDVKSQSFEYVPRGRSRRVPEDENLILLHINSVISLKDLGEDTKLYAMNHLGEDTKLYAMNHRKRKAY